MVGCFARVFPETAQRCIKLIQFDYHCTLVARDKPPLEECVYGGVELIGNPPCGLIWECDAHCFYDLFQPPGNAKDIHVFRSGKFPESRLDLHRLITRDGLATHLPDGSAGLSDA